MNKLLVVSCTSGLCNRLHAILGGKSIASALGRELRVFWPENQELSAPIEDVLVTPPPVVHEGEFSYLVSRPEIRTLVYNSGFSADPECDHIVDSDHDVIVIKPWFVPHIHGHGHTSSTYFALRRYLPEMQLKIHGHYDQDLSNHVGLHIRFGDLRDGLYTHTEYFSQSSVSRFTRIIDGILEMRPETQFYLASPNRDLLAEFRLKYGVDTQDSVTGDRSPKGIQQAITDLTNLAKCRCLIGSYRSQFTRMVGLMTGEAVAIVSDSSHMDHVDCWPVTDRQIAEWATSTRSGTQS